MLGLYTAALHNYYMHFSMWIRPRFIIEKNKNLTMLVVACTLEILCGLDPFQVWQHMQVQMLIYAVENPITAQGLAIEIGLSPINILT